ncbi:MAG TPA: ATP-binding protein [Thermoanaerobaculia bacterium]|nr:ATP-binding protein [Thermoanaerobaculia bacterium]
MGTPLDETRNLRRCVRELAALSALSAAWGRTDPKGIAASLANVLLRSVTAAEFLYVRALGPPQDPSCEVVHTAHGEETADRAREIGRALQPLLRCSPGSAPQISNPFGDGEARLAVIPMGYDGDCGYVVAGSRQLDFPTQVDRLLLGVGANQATVALQHKRAEAVLQETDRRKDEFLAILAHELRNPLAPLRNALHVMRLAGSNPNPATLDQTRGMMERQVQQMVHLIDDLLDISRITRGKVELRKERVELAAVVRDALETCRPIIEAGGHELTVSLPPEPITLDADPTRLAQVFANLLNNAAKYTPRGGSIRLSAEQQGNEIVVKVRDTGIGIPADMLPRVFEMFTQVDRSLERSQGGLGIGLSLVRGLVELHGGSVEARSEGPGRGSEFLVCLSVNPPARAAHAAPNDRRQAAPPRHRILVVDDNRDAADSLALLLTLQGSEVRTAYDGLEAIDAAAAFDPDVVLSDLGMPRMNGYEAARKIRERCSGRVVLVAMTGWGQEEDKRRSSAAGFDYHLVKPVALDDLEQLLASLEAPDSKAAPDNGRKEGCSTAS